MNRAALVTEPLHNVACRMVGSVKTVLVPVLVPVVRSFLDLNPTTTPFKV